jgi:hypothetical protein
VLTFEPKNQKQNTNQNKKIKKPPIILLDSTSTTSRYSQQIKKCPNQSTCSTPEPYNVSIN